MKRPWIFAGLLLAALALGVIGGTVAAQRINAASDASETRRSFADRVAEILGLSVGEVQHAFTQAHREGQDARVQRHLDWLQEQEKINAEDATAVMRWFTDRPDAAVYLQRTLLVGEEAIERRLERMVDRDRITEAEAEAVMDWYEDRPEVLSELASHRSRGNQQRFHHRFHQRGFDGGEFRLRQHREHQWAPVPYRKRADQTDL